MKIRIDMDYTTQLEVPRVKEDIAEFKSRYQEEDIMWLIRGLDDRLYCADLLTMRIDAFPRGWMYGNETSFCIDAWVNCYTAVFNIRVYVGVDLDTHSFTITEFTRKDLI